MIDSGACAKTLACSWRFKSAVHVLAEALRISEEETARLIAYVAAIHDCYGKAHPAFQKKSTCDAEVFHQAWRLYIPMHLTTSLLLITS